MKARHGFMLRKSHCVVEVMVACPWEVCSKPYMANFRRTMSFPALPVGGTEDLLEQGGFWRRKNEPMNS